MHILFVNNAWTCIFDVSFLFAWKKVTNSANFIGTDYHEEASCTSAQVKPLQRNTLKCFLEVCSLYRGCEDNSDERDIWRTEPVYEQCSTSIISPVNKYLQLLKSVIFIYFKDFNFSFFLNVIIMIKIWSDLP